MLQLQLPLPFSLSRVRTMGHDADRPEVDAVKHRLLDAQNHGRRHAQLILVVEEFLDPLHLLIRVPLSGTESRSLSPAKDVELDVRVRRESRDARAFVKDHAVILTQGTVEDRIYILLSALDARTHDVIPSNLVRTRVRTKLPGHVGMDETHVLVLT